MDLIFVIGIGSISVSFVTTLILIRYWIKNSRKFGLVGRDLNKFQPNEIPDAGGIAVVFGFSFAILIFIFLKTFVLGDSTNLIEIFALLSSIILAGFLGFMDDILGWKKGIKQWQKPSKKRTWSWMVGKGN